MKATAVGREPEVALVMNAGALAGRLKKFERGDYGKKELKEFVQHLIPKVLSTVQLVCESRGKGLADAAVSNKTKIEKRLASGLLKGDGSNREDAGIQGICSGSHGGS